MRLGIEQGSDSPTYRSRLQRNFEQAGSPSSSGEVVSVDPFQKSPNAVIRQPTPSSSSGGSGSVVTHNALPRRDVAKREMAELGLGKAPELWGVKQDLSAPKYTFLAKKREFVQKRRELLRPFEDERRWQEKLLSPDATAKYIEQVIGQDASSPSRTIHMPPTSSDGNESVYSLIYERQHRGGGGSGGDDGSAAGDSMRSGGNKSHQSFHSFDEFAADLAASVSSAQNRESASVNHDDDTITLSRVAVNAKIPVVDARRGPSISMDSRFNSFDSVDLTIGEPVPRSALGMVSSPIRTVNAGRALTGSGRLQELLRKRTTKERSRSDASNRNRNPPGVASTGQLSKSIPTVSFSFVNSTEPWTINSVKATGPSMDRTEPKAYFEKMQTGGRSQRLPRNISRVLQTEQGTGLVQDLNAARATKRGRDYRALDGMSYVHTLQTSVRICAADREFAVDFQPNDSLRTIKLRIADIIDMPAYQQTLFFNGKILHDNDIPLCAQNIMPGDTLDLVVHRATEVQPLRSSTSTSWFQPRTAAIGLPPTLPRPKTPVLAR